MDSKLKFMLKGALWIAIGCTIIVAACGLIWGSVIEGSLFAEIAKYAVGNLGIICILETFWYTLGQICYFWQKDYREKYAGDKWWFFKGIRDDLVYLKEQITWKKVGKILLYYVIFFAVFGLIIWILP